MHPTAIEKPWSADDADSGARRPRRRHLFSLLWLAAIAVLLGLTTIFDSAQKWLWMRQLDYAGVFWTILSAKLGIFVAAFAVAFLFLWSNLRFAVQSIVSGRQDNTPEVVPRGGAPGNRPTVNFDLSPRLLTLLYRIGAAVISLILAIGVSTQWDTYLRFRYGGSFGSLDPLFHVDLGFYLFRLPFYELVQGSLAFLTTIVLAAVVVSYVFFGLLEWSRARDFSAHRSVARHLSTLLFFLIAVYGWGFYLDHYDLVYSSVGVVYGAGYTAAHVTRIALWVMTAASAAACLLLAANFFRPRIKAMMLGIGVYAFLYVAGVMVLPALFQKFVVQPNELRLETPYLTQYIQATREAYNLNKIQETSYPALEDLTPAAIARNQDTIQNIRLWDDRPLLQTYQQTQAIRLYYQFYNVDVDRYHLADGYHQVMLSARELSAELPAQAQTWVNQQLQFTHGFGLVMNFVSKTSGNGLPQYLLENIPPESSYGLKIDQPGIYFGEEAPGYRIVATKIKEFDYPKGDQNVYTSYQGKGGIPLNSLWKRLLFAWTQKDVNILLTSYLNPESRIQIWRGVRERVSGIAPFLLFDKDPYPVLSGGRLYWIQDAYTASDHYPYSSPITGDSGAGLNYIRNSVKIVVDMYNGTVRFYIMDRQDPVLSAYRRAFPGMFRDLNELSPDLKSHLRYPEDLFAIQASKYEAFHMTDPQVFYNREDLWVPPLQRYEGSVTAMEPHYVLMKLPGSSQLEYLIMTSFTPQNRDNMVAWMAARCDFPDYGKMLLYDLPKDKLIYGPNQISAMINQSTEISQQLTLWDQKGSQVIRGKLIVIPVENAFLYVVPVYLKAEGTSFPELKRVIVATGDKVVMEPTLDDALSALFTGQPAPAAAGANGTTGATGPAQAPLPQATLEQVKAQLAAAQKAIKSLEDLLTPLGKVPAAK